MDVQEIIAQARDAVTVKRVYGEPVEKDGIVLIPAAKVAGGAAVVAAKRAGAGSASSGIRSGPT